MLLQRLKYILEAITTKTNRIVLNNLKLCGIKVKKEPFREWMFLTPDGYFIGEPWGGSEHFHICIYAGFVPKGFTKISGKEIIEDAKMSHDSNLLDYVDDPMLRYYLRYSVIKQENWIRQTLTNSFTVYSVFDKNNIMNLSDALIRGKKSKSIYISELDLRWGYEIPYEFFEENNFDLYKTIHKLPIRNQRKENYEIQYPEIELRDWSKE